MKREVSRLTAIFVLALTIATPANGSVHQVSKHVGVIMPPDSRDCIFFQLVGVSEADPIVPGSPWIAVPRGDNGFTEIYALLLWAKSTGTPITVETNSQAQSTCGGMVGVWQVYSAS
jgi:hypothetical protein